MLEQPDSTALVVERDEGFGQRESCEMHALAAGQTPVRDSVSAFGHVLQTDFVGAGEAGPNGEGPVGSLTVSGFLNFTTETTCLNVSGNAVVSGGRILTGRDAGRGFLSSSIDRGPPVDGKPVDVIVFSGRLPRPPRNCPSPGDTPPEQLQHTGGGPFTSGDLIVVDAVERLPPGAPVARVRVLGIAGGGPGVGLVTTRRAPTVRIRVCGAPGMALLRVTLRTSPLARRLGDRAPSRRGAGADHPTSVEPACGAHLRSGVGASSLKLAAEGRLTVGTGLVG